MTQPKPPLSPAAQAVLDAASISVALRALIRDYGVKTRGGGVLLNGHDVLAIAAELEEATQLSLQPHLSVEAQAVLDAYSKVANSNILNGSRWIEAAIAAVLHATADAVAPEAAPHRRNIRAELLALAAELEDEQ